MSNGLMMEGFLVKEGGSIKTWKKRWCTLRDGVLSYHAKKVRPATFFLSTRNTRKMKAYRFAPLRIITDA
jgi:hypothetical protein